MAVTKAKVFLWIFMPFVLAGALFAGYLWVALHWSYSKGERAGYVQKFSQKGWLIKTWEGELALVAVPGSMPEKFFFTVRDDELAKRINAAVGKRIAIAYEQHKGLPSNWFGDTDYFAYELKVIE
ncbi:MAG: hypothetical protein H6Q56_29 [Deltaproteobacteria bacterium]|nr:hypothetical protein [Deltaproteobacteria bacterium]